jgi:pyrroloquinoline-quinone synthase
MCKTRIDKFNLEEPIVVHPLKAFPLVKDLVTDVSWNYEGIGVTQADVRSSTVLPKTASSVNTMKTLTRSENYLEGVAALYAYESQIPHVSRVKREGLEIFYGISDERAVSFFTVHEEADLAHRETERLILANNATDAATRRLVLDAAQGSAKAFLDGVYEAFV